MRFGLRWIGGALRVRLDPDSRYYPRQVPVNVQGTEALSRSTRPHEKAFGERISGDEDEAERRTWAWSDT